MSDILVGILATFGTVFVLLAAVGLIRMPDTYLRISVTTKAATLGIGLILIAAAVYFNDLSITSRVLAIILFIVLTAPIAAHLIGRASYFIGIKLWDKSIMDDLKGKYKKRTHELSSEDTNDRSNSEDNINK
ncbi:monovalent cation/H(+) antiporter subunit G [Winogradskyella helgolandensis]|uniref:monovalent cation/H(+) antiporter subunit G n=1 Tax=Winogradskyella helgolandensis TaxID=2697010 RepID=UPI0015B7A9A5|nr:monovalent cation/H(+) antiporter subunit G [Winogradskyella helgolandensis]